MVDILSCWVRFIIKIFLSLVCLRDSTGTANIRLALPLPLLRNLPNATLVASRQGLTAFCCSNCKHGVASSSGRIILHKHVCTVCVTGYRETAQIRS